MPKSRKKKGHIRKKTNQVKLFMGAGGLVVVILILTGTWHLNRDNPSIVDLANEITVIEAARLRDEGAYILDVRQPEEWRQYHIPDSTHIPLNMLNDRLNEVPRDRAVIVVCREGNRSLGGRDILKQAGFELVTSMVGGLQQWHAMGFQLVPGE